VTNPPGALDCLSDLEPLALPPGYEDAEVILSISGGKDSAAAALRLRASGIAFRAVFADTGWEAKETYAHLETMERVLGQPIERVRASKSMREKILERAGFPGRSERWCTRELKVEVLRAYHDRVIDETGRDTLSVVGIRAEESAERAALPVFEFSNEWGGAVWRPVRDLTIAQVLALHHCRAMPLNPLYLRGHNRVGCWPCVYAGKEEIALIAEHDPARIDEIDGLESVCGALRAERNAERPGRYEHAVAPFFQARIADRHEDRRVWLPRVEGKAPKGRRAPDQGPPPAGEWRTVKGTREWFMAGLPGRPKGTRAKEQGPPPDGEWRIVRQRVFRPMRIREVVAWARTDRGGRQLPVFREPPHGGCFRWGMCEPPARDKSVGDTANAGACDAA